MRFEFEITTNNTIITAIPENDMELNGIRAEYPYKQIKLVDRKLIIDYVPKNIIHPDIIGLICITAFYPFIKYSATMPFPVTQNFADAFKLPEKLLQHDVIDSVYTSTHPIIITNIDNNLAKYDGSSGIIAYGGGADSTAVALLLPEYTLVNQLDKDIHLDALIKSTYELKNDKIFRKTNIRSLFSPYGFSGWTNIFLLPLLILGDNNYKNIMCGGVLETTFLQNGKKYFPATDPKRLNKWNTAYKDIGVNIFSPIGGCSEFMTSKLVIDNNMADKVLYCQTLDGYPCHKCIKCFRKNLLFEYLGVSYDKKYWNNYDTLHIIKNLQNPDLTPAFTYKHCLMYNISSNKPEKIMVGSSSKPQEFNPLNRIYAKSFDLIPIDMKNVIKTRLLNKFEEMTSDDTKYIESFDIKNVYTDVKWSNIS
jgi:hypothetical protein